MRTFTVVEVDKLFTLIKELLPVFRHEAIELVVFDGPCKRFDVPKAKMDSLKIPMQVPITSLALPNASIAEPIMSITLRAWVVMGMGAIRAEAKAFYYQNLTSSR